MVIKSELSESNYFSQTQKTWDQPPIQGACQGHFFKAHDSSFHVQRNFRVLPTERHSEDEAQLVLQPTALGTVLY